MNFAQLNAKYSKKKPAKKYGASYNEFCRRKDKNHNAIRDALLTHGFSVKETHTARGFVDLVAGKHGLSFLVEVKGEGKDVKDKQADFHASWKGHICVVRTVEDVQRLDVYAGAIKRALDVCKSVGVLEVHPC